MVNSTTQSKLDTKHLIGVGMVILGAIGFASKAILVKLLYRYGIDTSAILTLRTAFALPFFVAVLVYHHFFYAKHKSIPRKDFAWLLVMGFFGYYLSSLLDFWGLQYVSAGLERLILFIYPTLVIIFSAIIFKKKISKIQVYALLLTYAGIILAMNTDFSAKGTHFYWGASLIFCSAITYTFYLLGSEKLIPRIGAILYASWVMLFATFFIFLHFFLFGKTSITSLPREVYLLSMLMALIATVIPIFLTSEGIRRIGAGDMAIAGNIGPVSTIGLGYVFLDEPILFWQLIGTSLVLIGIFLISAKKSKNYT